MGDSMSDTGGGFSRTGGGMIGTGGVMSGSGGGMSDTGGGISGSGGGMIGTGGGMSGAGGGMSGMCGIHRYKYRGKARWVTEAELLRLHTKNTLKSPELMEFFMLIKTNDPSCQHLQALTYINNMNLRPEEFSYVGNFVEINNFSVISGILPTEGYDQVVESAGLDINAQEVLYKQFQLLCFPSMFMSKQTFTKFLQEAKWSKEDAVNLFRAADSNARYGLSFKEFLHFIVALEPNTPHGGSSAELRCRYIFRYFDKDLDNLLNLLEFKNLIITGRELRKLSFEPNQVNKEVCDCYRAMGLLEGSPITLTEFLQAVGDLKLRGTSQLFRAPISIHTYIKELREKNIRDQEWLKHGAVLTKQSLSNVSTTKLLKPLLKGPAYNVAVHTVKVQKFRSTVNLEEIWNVENSISISTTTQKTLSLSQKESLDILSKDSDTLNVLKTLKDLKEATKKLIRGSKSSVWEQFNTNAFGKNLISVCETAKKIFAVESRLLELVSPVYIFGDLHGSFADLMYFEDILWHIGLSLCPSALLFLGDFVDRGSQGIEVIAYLLANKIQSPNKIFLLRGNHEIREIQNMFTFHTECHQKFGDKLGEEVWNAINDTFDTLPLAATIDGRIFCCHGGIPPPWLCPAVTAINDIPVPLRQPDEQSTLAWELMWNDPARSKALTENLSLELLANEGFAMNTRRGTAHIFNSEALDRFLRSNGFSHLVRAHEVAQTGFFLQQKGKLITIFSSSRYCGIQNEAACVLADQQKLRILRMQLE